MKILFINNDGGGFADFVEVAEGTNLRQFFESHMGHAKSDDYLIRVNRQPVHGEQVLLAGHRISMTPVKIEGASN